jgi:hypothetical protein
MPDGKLAGVQCIHLTSDYLCAVYDHPDRPGVCRRLRAEEEMCGSAREEALAWFAEVELATRPPLP